MLLHYTSHLVRFWWNFRANFPNIVQSTLYVTVCDGPADEGGGSMLDVTRCAGALTCVCILQSFFLVEAADILWGDSTDGKQSFINPVRVYAMGHDGRFYVGASQEGAKDFAVAGAVATGKKFLPLTPEKVSNGIAPSVDNPLYDASIRLMALMHGTESILEIPVDRLAVVKEKQSAVVHLIDNTMSTQRLEVLSSAPVIDASGSHETAGIIALEAHTNALVFAAVTDGGGNPFGRGSSGIAVLARGRKGPAAQEPLALFQLDAQLGSTCAPGTGGRAALLSATSGSVAIGDAAIDILDNAVDLHWDANLQVLYIALNVHSVSQAGAGGAAAVVAASMVKDKLFFKRVVDSGALSPDLDAIVAGVGETLDISIHKVRSLTTTTSVNYLVVLGGYGTPHQTRRTVYALPVVKRADVYNGVLAKKDAPPQTWYAQGYPTRFFDRGFTQRATTTADLCVPGDVEATVGGGPLDVGDITTIFTQSDAVFAVVSVPDAGYQPGIFHSQAIFDASGSIKQWTAWRRGAGNFFDTLWGADFDEHSGSFTMLVGKSADAIYTAKRTVWGAGDEHGCAGLVHWLNTVFPGPAEVPEKRGPIQGLYDFSSQTPGLASISVIVATGNGCVALAQTGVVRDGILTALGGDDLARDPCVFADGAIDQALSATTNAVAISGGDLERTGALEAACITRVADSGYIFVGGTGGLAVLVNDAGVSWDAREGLGNNLAGLDVESRFKEIGNYKFIRALRADETRGLLYVVCDDRLACIDIARSNFVRGTLSETTLARRPQWPLASDGTILDAVITSSLIILATSNGLFEKSDPSLDWHAVDLPEGYCSVNGLYPISYDARQQSLSAGTGGMVYALDSHPGINRSAIHRFTVATQEGAHLEELPDLFVKDKPSYFVDCDGFRAWIACDGATLFNARDRNLCEQPSLEIIPERVRSGTRFGGIGSYRVPIALDNVNIVGPIVRLSTTGSWLLAQDTALTVNE